HRTSSHVCCTLGSSRDSLLVVSCCISSRTVMQRRGQATVMSYKGSLTLTRHCLEIPIGHWRACFETLQAVYSHKHNQKPRLSCLNIIRADTAVSHCTLWNKEYVRAEATNVMALHTLASSLIKVEYVEKVIWVNTLQRGSSNVCSLTCRAAACTTLRTSAFN